MTRSPFAVTLIPLLPLAALGWPLAKILNAPAYTPPPPPEKATASPVIPADFSVQSAHPFTSLSVTAGETTWVFAPEDDIKEIQIPEGTEVFLTVTIVWPPETPETAVLIRLWPESREERSHTLWGQGEVTESVKFTWEDPS